VLAECVGEVDGEVFKTFGVPNPYTTIAPQAKPEVPNCYA
jgi:hypothetical protein